MAAEWERLSAQFEQEWARFFDRPEEVAAALGDVDDLVGVDLMDRIRREWDAADLVYAGATEAGSGGPRLREQAALPNDASGPGLGEQLACLTGFRSLLAGVDGLDTTGPDGDGADLALATLAGMPVEKGNTSRIRRPSDDEASGTADAARIDVLAALEALAGAVAAAQVRVTVSFVRSQVESAAAAGRSVIEAERGVAPQVAMARGCSASVADRHIAMARSLTTVLPRTMAALTAGRIGETHAVAVHAGSRCLTEELRRVLDERIAPDLGTCTPRRLRKRVDGIAAELDAAAVAARHADAVRSRGVWTRPAPDGMCYLTILGPLHEIVGAFASVRAYAGRVVAGHAGEDPDGRSLSQVMADTAVARLEGRAAGQAQPVTVNLVMTPESLYGHARTPYPSDPTPGADTAGSGAHGAAGPAAGYGWADPSTTATTAGSSAAKTPNPAPTTPDTTSAASSTSPSATSTPRADNADARGRDTVPVPAATPAPGADGSSGGNSIPVATPLPGTRSPGGGDSVKTPAAASAGNPADAGPTSHRGAAPPPRGAGSRMRGDAHPSLGRPRAETHPISPGDEQVPRSFRNRPGTQRQAPGDGDQCSGVNTPARIVGHGHVPAALARAWLLAGCDDHTDTDTTAANASAGDPFAGDPFAGSGDATDPQHSGDHDRQPDHDAESRADDWQTQWDATPPPATLARAAEVWVRRAFTSPDGRDLVALETTARLFPPALRSMLVLRDDTCRIPYCDAQIGHADHITPWADGGRTTLTNGQGLSIRCNYTKDLAGFTTRILTRDEVTAYARGPDDGEREADGETRCHRNRLVARSAGPDTHVTEFRTPTGHVYLSAAPPLETRRR